MGCCCRDKINKARERVKKVKASNEEYDH